MIDFNQFNLKTVSKTEVNGVFVIRPLPKGYGIGVANLLRRTLYSSVPGCAITSVKVNGAEHEYTSLRGVADDVLNIMLSLKNLVFKLNSADKVVLTLSKKGAGDVVGSDFDKNSSVELINPDYVITKLSESNSTLDLEVTIEKGQGYSFADDSKRAEVGMIPLDSDFTSVKRVSYTVEQTREGRDFDLDQINLEVETDGSVDPFEALKIACENLNHLTSHLVETTYGKIVEVQRVHSNISPQKKVDLSLDKLNISTRLYNCLDKIGIKTLNELEGKTRKDVNDIRGLGDKSKKELLKILQKYEIEVRE